MYFWLGDCNSPLVPMDCHADHSTKSCEVAVSTSDTALTPAVYSLVTETLPLPERAQEVGMVVS